MALRKDGKIDVDVYPLNEGNQKVCGLLGVSDGPERKETPSVALVVIHNFDCDCCASVSRFDEAKIEAMKKQDKFVVNDMRKAS